MDQAILILFAGVAGFIDWALGYTFDNIEKCIVIFIIMETKEVNEIEETID